MASWTILSRADEMPSFLILPLVFGIELKLFGSHFLDDLLYLFKGPTVDGLPICPRRHIAWL